MVIQRGEVWWVQGRTRGGGRTEEPHPVVVVQSDAFNRSRIPTILVALVSSDPDLAEAPGNLALTQSQSGLPRETVVVVSRLLSLDRRCLLKRAGCLPEPQLRALDEGLRLILSVNR